MTIRHDITYTVPASTEGYNVPGACVEHHTTLYRKHKLTTRGIERIVRWGYVDQAPLHGAVRNPHNLVITRVNTTIEA